MQPPIAAPLSLDHRKLELGKDDICNAVLLYWIEVLRREDRLKKQFGHVSILPKIWKFANLPMS